ncbi:MAG: hypothetical protein GY702_13415 [Desulfobulbaceae bacterium]|nr:hypothetical protein [Desulfobulbaceae bacterium]
MTELTWTITQERRLKELGINLQDTPGSFSSAAERNKLFQQLEKAQVKSEMKQLSSFLSEGGRVPLEALSEKITTVNSPC